MAGWHVSTAMRRGTVRHENPSADADRNGRRETRCARTERGFGNLFGLFFYARMVFRCGERQTKEVAGFYTLTAASIALNALAPDIVRKLPRCPVVPAALMGRCAMAGNYQGGGLGGVLLSNAVLRVARPELGVFAMLVDAKDAAAHRFYEHYEFTLLAGEERRLCLPIALGLRQFEGRTERPA